MASFYFLLHVLKLKLIFNFHQEEGLVVRKKKRNCELETMENTHNKMVNSNHPAFKKDHD